MHSLFQNVIFFKVTSLSSQLFDTFKTAKIEDYLMTKLTIQDNTVFLKTSV